jgi:hypothetical protein
MQQVPGLDLKKANPREEEVEPKSDSEDEDYWFLKMAAKRGTVILL